MRIGEVAAQAGVSVRALRYYEEQGLLVADRSPSGQRRYPPGAVDRVRFIQNLYAAGLGSRAVLHLPPAPGDSRAGISSGSRARCPDVEPTGLADPLSATAGRSPPGPTGPLLAWARSPARGGHAVPFTLAHPAAVLPLAREPFVTAALVAGAVAPDLPYFLRATGVPVTAQSWYEPFTNATTAHTMAGAATVGLPLAAALYLAYLGARPAGLALLADAGPRRAGPTVRRRASRWVWVAVSLAVGLATHLAWDSFTHGDGAVVTRVPVLRATAAAGDLTWARLLQHVSTVVGLAVLAGYGWRRRAALPQRGAPARRRLTLAAAAAVAACATGATLGARRWWSGDDGLDAAAVLEGVLSDAAKGAGVALAVASATAVLAWWVHRVVAAWPAPGRVAQGP